MSLHDDLLEQAEHLAHRDAGRPKQASLRRAISTAYYALFHLLVREATNSLVTDAKLRGLVPRAFTHTEMKQACAPFLSGNLPDHLREVAGATVPDDLRFVANAFKELQEARHDADYNVVSRFDRSEAIGSVQQARRAFEAWARVRNQPVAVVFLVNLLLGTKWKR